MPLDRKQIGSAPEWITCDPLSRAFPPAWKDIWFRRLATRKDGKPVYTCPLCNEDFDHTLIDYLQGDHVWPFSLMGETAWANYQLICGKCNATKSNLVDIKIRQVLGEGEFRSLIIDFLKGQIRTGGLRSDFILESILGACS